MAVSFPLTLPSTPGFVEVRISLVTTVAASQSLFTHQQQVYEYDGEWWEADCILPPMTRADAELWNAKLLSLRGRLGRFNLCDTSSRQPLGSQVANAAVNGAGQTGKTLAIDGLTGTGTGVIKPGTWLQIVGGSVQRLHKTVTEVTVAAGAVTLDIVPRLRETPSDNAVITFVNPVGEFRLATNRHEWTADKAKIFGIQFKATEAI